MALLYLTIALVIQVSITQASLDSEEVIDNEIIINNNTEVDDEVIRDYHEARKDWIDDLILPDTNLFPTSSVSMMTQAMNSNKSVDEQLEDIKEIAQKITLAIQSEMANLLSYALLSFENEKTDNTENQNLRKKRSAESPIASTQLITRLLKHIKSNNEFQNIAIDKMMTAQEIADKYGIEFSPDAEVISDLAFAANQQAKEMNSLLQDTLNMRNFSKGEEFVKENEYQQQKQGRVKIEPVINHYYSDAYPSHNYYSSYPYETQIPAPAMTHYNNPPVSKRPSFYDAVSYSPDPSYCAMDRFSSSNILFTSEETYEPEPELVGEEFEETVSSKIYVNRENEPGSATVNHVMTYTVAEKSHFKSPEIEKLPQQVQYSFFLL